MKKIAINGFGRIGRLAFRQMLDRNDLAVVAINDLTDVDTLAHLLKFDSIHGRFNGTVEVAGGNLVVNGSTINISAERDEVEPAMGFPGHRCGCGIDRCVHEQGEGGFAPRSRCRQGGHLCTCEGELKTVVLGVNDDILTADDRIVSNASCTTNCLAPMAKVLDDEFGVEHGLITTIHAYTADQRIQDAPHKDLRRARAAALSMIPTSTGAAKAVGLVLPQLAGKLDGLAVRVPTQRVRLPI